MTERLRSGEPFLYPEEELPADASAERTYVGDAGTRASILVPVFVVGELSGAVILDA